MTLAHPRHGIVQRNGVPRHQPVEHHARRARTARAGTRAPAPPQRRPAVEKMPVDHRGEVSADAAATFELAEDFVVVLDDFEVNGRLELLDRIGVETVTAADELDDLIDDGEMVEELAFE